MRGFRRPPSVVLAVGVGLLLGLPAHSTIVDTGDVVLSGNHLVIGDTAAGSRTVDADTDGPYGSVTLGANGGSGELTLDNASAFSTNGPLNLGAQSIVSLFGGSSLETAGASAPKLLGHSTVTIEGADSRWENSGVLGLEGTRFSVLKGATATDAGVNFGYLAAAQVDGSGSLWSTGAFTALGLQEPPGTPILEVTNGGRVQSSTAFVIAASPQSVVIEGLGSTWSIEDRLVLTGQFANRVSVTSGGVLEAGEMRSNSGDISIVGDGSRLDVDGTLGVVDFNAVGSGLTLDEGASAHVRGDTHVASYPTQFASSPGSAVLAVRGSGSLFHTDGILALGEPVAAGSANGSTGGLLTVGTGGRVEAGSGISVYAPSRIELAGGTLDAPRTALLGGVLKGEGVLEGDLGNGGRVAPGAGVLEVKGSFEQTSDGVLEVELGGTKAGIEHSLLEVLGTSFLAGSLEVTVAEGYEPSLGDAYEILRAGCRVGEFDGYAGLDVGNGLSLAPDYAPHGVWLRVVPEPGTGVLVLGGLVALAARRRRRA